jgi:hypothetical protein
MTVQELTLEKQTWIERFVEVLIDPRQAFDRIHSENADRLTGLPGAFLVALLVLVLDGVRSTATKSASAIDWSTTASIILGLSYWLCLSGLIAILAMCFGRSKQDIRGAVVSFGWSFAPWIFMAPLFCYQHSVGSFFVVMASIPAVWMFVLQFLALMRNFALKWWHAALLVFVAPILFGAVRVLEAIQAIYLCASSCGH